MEIMLDDKGEQIYEGLRQKTNPAYDPSLTYVSRFERKEWDAVGMLGVLHVRHDGTAKVNGFITINDNGIATNCNNNSIKSYRVIKVINENVCKIIFK